MNPDMEKALAALKALKEGNLRYQSGQRNADSRITPERREELSTGQAPDAIILGCADSRVPAEIIFDQGLGDLFVVRVAGNIATSEGIGSIEYAIEHLGSRLIVVLGHSSCGAVQATIGELKQASEGISPNIQSLVDEIGPAISQLVEAGDTDELLGNSIRANVSATLKTLASKSEIIQARMEAEEVLIVGAEYSLANGVVDFFEGMPDA